jgi:endonuclease/exonuclease/phosphatase (EEP) superfamily protein YafD
MDAQIESRPAANVWRSRLAAAVRIGCWLASGMLLVIVAACYWRRFDACTFVTLFPPWCWTTGGMLLAWFAYTSHRRWPGVLLVVLWLAFLLAASDTPLSFARACRREPERKGMIRVVSLNCAGNSAAVRDIQRMQPDVVLIQESPSADTLAALATELFGSRNHLVRGYDPSILARGKVTSVPIPPQYYQNFVHARVELDGRVINLISLRLFPCPVNLEFWSADCWRYYRANRENRRRQLATIAAYAKTLPPDEPLVLGGDFNCPPRDAVLEVLQPWLTDAFETAGRGWGATIIELSGVPLIRIDQIWTNSQFRVVDAFARRAYGSDHHMTIADLECRSQQTP